MSAGRTLAIGVGCRSGISAEAVVAQVERALAAAGGMPGAPVLFTIVDKRQEAGLAEAAAGLGLPLVFLPRTALAAVADKAETRSERVVDLFGVPSVAETAALAGAGDGARLVVKRMAADGVTVAVAVAAVSDGEAAAAKQGDRP